jgi:PIN domain nuclease of toxin-antitoxin system
VRRILLDTHLLVWALSTPDRLAPSARAAIDDADSEMLFSAASIWEVAIKVSLGRIVFSGTPSDLVAAALDADFRELPVTSVTAMRVADLPFHHRDPLDRLLIAQAIAEPAYFYTADRALKAYSELVVAAG